MASATGFGGLARLLRPAPWRAISLDLTAVGGASIPCSAASEYLRASVPRWRAAGVTSAWLRVDLPTHAPLLEGAMGAGFALHHARGSSAVLLAWLGSGPCKVPPWGGTQVGVGGVCIDSRGRVLLVRERGGRSVKPGGAGGDPDELLSRPWKFPGGLADAGEDFGACAVRETWEETGVRARAEGLLGLRHSHGLAWGVSDIYALALLRPLEPGGDEPLPLRIDASEIAEAQWVDAARYGAAPATHVLPLLAHLARAALAEARARGWVEGGGGGGGAVGGVAGAGEAGALGSPAAVHQSTMLEGAEVFSAVTRRWTRVWGVGVSALDGRHAAAGVGNGKPTTPQQPAASAR